MHVLQTFYLKLVDLPHESLLYIDYVSDIYPKRTSLSLAIWLAIVLWKQTYPNPLNCFCKGVWNGISWSIEFPLHNIFQTQLHECNEGGVCRNDCC